MPVVNVDHLADARRLGLDHVISEQDGERFSIHQVLRHHYRVTETESLLLPNICDPNEVRDSANQTKELGFSPLLEDPLELE